ncbi:hypothetical protein CPB83DRAFT_854694 [Crepidotus variabilis]|uniref:Uncharacterized protein n=1 Tax=Crepidotus variabilis TaxID=179855 RepID=A0A9P6JP85_9AGAR|nr:hypothetical protein CPB83DRAFT_854694 [Crepidotus variabilis]
MTQLKQPRRSLSSKQERRLVNYLDEKLLEITRNFKKRTELSSTLQTLPEYLDVNRTVLALILQIPPLDPSTGLRIAYLLRLTSEILSSIPGYKIGTLSSPVHLTLRDLLDFLDDLDQAWLAVLQGKVWDPELAEGVDLEFPIDLDLTESEGEDDFLSKPFRSSPPSQTDLTRLRSLLFAGGSTLEEWLSREKRSGNSFTKDDTDDVSAMLENLGLLDQFDALFVKTLDYLGGFSGDVAHNVVDPELEVIMDGCN